MNGVIQSVWTFLGPVQEELVGLGFSLLAAFLVFLFRPRVKLIYGKANNSRNVISVPRKGREAGDDGGEGEGDEEGDGDSHSTTEIYTEKFFLQNVGRRVATNVEFVLSAFPNDISVWQPRKVTYTSVEKGNCLVEIPQISPKELVIIDCVYLNQRAAFVTSVKCAEVMGKEVAFWTLRRYPNWFYYFAGMVGLFGMAFVVQILIKLVGA